MIKTNFKLVIVVFILLPFCLNAQREEMSTLFGGNKEIRTGGYGAFEIKLSQLDSDFSGLLLGGRGGVIINNVFSIGGAGYGLVPTKKINCPISGHENEKNNFWTGGYGGLFFEYINSSNNLVHFTVNTLIGAGGITYVSHSDFSNFNKHPTSVTLVLEPGIGVELNIFKIFRMYLGASYRYAPGFEFKYDDINNVQNDIVPTTAFNGLSVNLAFKFGNFTGHTNAEREAKIKDLFGIE
ncbi:MAG: hypothetical protein FWG85_07955 [Bacteroidetes bacterium]|nr:hypothetical protein [Bacteroidota bacterium]